MEQTTHIEYTEHTEQRVRKRMEGERKGKEEREAKAQAHTIN
jgi:hypothetical protein